MQRCDNYDALAPTHATQSRQASDIPSVRHSGKQSKPDRNSPSTSIRMTRRCSCSMRELMIDSPMSLLASRSANSRLLCCWTVGRLRRSSSGRCSGLARLPRCCVTGGAPSSCWLGRLLAFASSSSSLQSSFKSLASCAAKSCSRRLASSASHAKYLDTKKVSNSTPAIR